ncbi:MAG TPA: fumarylacetoacetate hydrolase family protein [Streptosporangiaceae bacterium]|nr:fumarylacetoacetate hydrolase family protein [Streptosporangiaceae bacterium]
MKLAFFDEFRLGVVRDDQIFDVSAVTAEIPRAHPQDVLRAVIEDWDEWRPRLDSAADHGQGVPLAAVAMRPPVPRPVTIDCMAVNYLEGGTLTALPPISAFHKTPSSVIGPGDTLVLPDVPATIFEGEAELALVVGRRGKDVPLAAAMDYVFGYTNLIDGSARGLPGTNVFYPMKSRDTFCPIGPFLVTKDEIPDPQNLAVRLWNNGELMQDFSTSDMAHLIPRCVEFISSVHTIEPGDLIATGTNHGGLNPFMDGDEIELEVEGLGRLRINVRDDLKRTWKRETRHDRQAQGKAGTTPQLTGKYAPDGER